MGLVSDDDDDFHDVGIASVRRWLARRHVPDRHKSAIITILLSRIHAELAGHGDVMRIRTLRVL